MSNRPEDDEIWIYAAALREADLAEVLTVLLRHRPDLMPAEIAERLPAP